MGGGKAADGALNPVFGVLGVDLLAGVGRPPVLFRVLATGRAGSAPVGGAFDGRDGRGSVADMVIASSSSKDSRLRRRRNLSRGAKTRDDQRSMKCQR